MTGDAAEELDTMYPYYRVQEGGWDVDVASLTTRDVHVVQDTHPAAEGDRALIAFSILLMEVFRESDVIGRIGGDEFVVLLTNAAKTASPDVLARLQEGLNKYNLRSERNYPLAYSVEVVEYDPEMHHSIGELLQEADTLMYQNKKRHIRVS